MRADKHTIGPWRIGASGHIHAGDVGSKPIAEVYGQGDDCDWQPNARLIAAAPELLAACQRIASIEDTDALSDIRSAVMSARSAIAKAEGKP